MSKCAVGTNQNCAEMVLIAATNGIAFPISISPAMILPKSEIEVGIEMARGLLSVCYIDERKCSRLIKCLECYHKRYNAAMNIYSNAPVHDWSSHFADAFRYCSMARALYRSGTSILTAEDWCKVREKHFPSCR